MSGVSRPTGGTKPVLTSDERGAGAPQAHESRGAAHGHVSHSPRRSSSGYFSLPASPLFQRADKATQTASPSAQVMEHAVRHLQAHSPSAQVMEHAVRHLQAHSPSAQVMEHTVRHLQAHSPSAQVMEHAVRHLQAHSPSARHWQHGGSSTRPADSMRDLQAAQVGRELREHGDEFNRILTQRAARGRPQWRLTVHQEPAVFFCVGFLIYFFGQLLYSHRTTYS